MDRPRRGWVRGPAWDLACLHFGWVAFYLLLVFGLGIDGRWSAGGVAGAGREPGLGAALTIALGASYVHRHYTFLIVYGDRDTYARHRGIFTVGAAAAFVLVALAYRGRSWLVFDVPGLDRPVSAWMLTLVATGAWNVWHTIMQRHGIHRVYAGLVRRVDAEAGARIGGPAQGRRDKVLLWSLVATVAVLVLMFRTSTFAGIGNARRLLALSQPWLGGAAGWSVLVAGVAWLGWIGAAWVRCEFGASLPAIARLPRLAAWFATLTLLAVFVVHGPVVGYLCFGTAHALEYVAFVHHFGRQKFAGRDDHGPPAGVLPVVLRHATVSAPLLIAALLAVYWLLLDARTTELFLVHYTATSLLHFWYDGLIWKVSKPAVSRPLGIEPGK